jgi:molybdopterin molybdotransferase
MGDYDLVKGVLGEQGLTIHFTRVAMKPGKPTVFASRPGGLIFGLPGNPVSTFVSFENFVRPALGRLCGMLRPELPRVRGRLLREMKQSPGRTAFLPAWVSMVHGAWEIDPLRWRGSGDIIGFSRCNATVIFPGDRDHMARDEFAEAMLLPDYFSRHRED